METAALIVVLVIAIGWRLLAGSRPQADGNVAVQGLRAPVTIVRDAEGITTITAQSRSARVTAEPEMLVPATPRAAQRELPGLF